MIRLGLNSLRQISNDSQKSGLTKSVINEFIQKPVFDLGKSESYNFTQNLVHVWIDFHISSLT